MCNGSYPQYEYQMTFCAIFNFWSHLMCTLFLFDDISSQPQVEDFNLSTDELLVIFPYPLIIKLLYALLIALLFVVDR